MDGDLAVSDAVTTQDVAADPIFDRGTPGTTTSTADQAPQTPAQGTSSTAQTALTPADPNLAAAVRPAQPQDATQAPTWRSIREEIASMGVKLGPNITDDRQALAHLVRQAESNRQADYYAQLGRQLAPHAPQLQQFLTQQQAPAAPNEWDRPHFDRRMLELVDFNEGAGRYVGKPGVPAEIVDSVNKYADWRNKWESEPEGFVDYRAEQVAQRVFEKMFSQNQQQFQTSSAVEQIRAQNQDWLYSKDAQGGIAHDFSGRPVLSAYGQRYAQHVAALSKGGMTDVRLQDQYARQAVASEIASARAAQNQPASPQRQQATTAPNSNPLGSLITPTQQEVRQGVPAPVVQGQSLQEMMRLRLQQEGVTDNDVQLG